MTNKLVLVVGLVLACSCSKQSDSSQPDIQISSSLIELVETFDWAKEKAKSFVQTGKTGPINISERNEDPNDSVEFIPSYWAGYPLRTAFYSRDFCHQALGAHLLGLQNENFSMLKAFAASADTGKKWYPLWAINFDGSPYELDYRSDSSFVREVPAVFELVETGQKLFDWTADGRFIEDETLWNYYSKAVTDFVELHDNQLPNGIAEGTGKGIFEGASTYNEQRDYPLIEAGDGIACQYAAYLAYSKMAAAQGMDQLAEEFEGKAEHLVEIFNEQWGTQSTESYVRGYTPELIPIDGWGKENSWFMPMKGLLDPANPRTERYLDFINERLESKDDIPDNIEAISYIPEVFFKYHHNETAWKWMKHIIANLDQEHAQESLTGRNGDYPEVSFVLVSNIVVDLMGIQANAGRNEMESLSHLPNEIDYLQVENVMMGKSRLLLQHTGTSKSELHHINGDKQLSWTAKFYGHHAQLFLNGEPQDALQGNELGSRYSFMEVSVKPGESAIVSVDK